MKQFILFILIVIYGCSSNISTNESSVGKLVINEKYFKDLRGGAVIKYKVFDIDSTLAIACLAIVDNKFISVVDMNGELNIRLNSEGCFELKIYSVGRLMFSNDELCFDSNTITKGEIYLEYFTDYRGY